jgi:3-deoxy-D-manno-octulosonic-acid transferase
MYGLYSLLLVLGITALLPRLLLDATRHGKYVTGLSQRLGNLPRIHRDGRRLVWLHCVSVGETLAARPLVDGLFRKFPDLSLVISTTTVTGQRVANEAFGSKAELVFYFPIDLTWIVRRALNRIAPDLILIMETEIWPNLLRECSRRGIPAGIVNGRLSETSFRRYRLIRRFISRVLGDISIAVMQSPEDAKRLEALGIPSERVFISGNIKFDVASDESMKELTAAFSERFELNGTLPVILAASTHDPEEAIIIESFEQVARDATVLRPRLIIAPRHPERFKEVASLIGRSGLGWARRSEPALDTDRSADVILLDSIGELRAVYPLATLVFVGGSITPHGGQNLLEPASASVAVITGPHTWNFAAVVEAMNRANALIQMPEMPRDETVKLLATHMKTLLSDDARREQMARVAFEVVKVNRGATDRTVSLISPLLVENGDNDDFSANFSSTRRSLTAQ